MPASYTKAELIRILQSQGIDVQANGRDESRFRGIEFDTRRISGGELFLALKGETTHGHHYVSEALAKGAALALVEDPAIVTDSDRDKLIVVPDTLRAFWEIARAYRATLHGKIVGITGSMGKTSAKEITSAILSSQGPGTYSKKSFNNHLGVPYTLCQASPDDQWVVLEMGMNHAGELRDLSQLARPDIAAILVIAPVHIEFFKDLAAIADAKSEILEGVPAGGTVFLNGSDTELRAAVERNPLFSNKIIRWFGESADSALRVRDVYSDPDGKLSFVLQTKAEQQQLSVPLVGKHNANLAALGCLVAREVYPTMTLAQCASALSSIKPPEMRLNITTLADGRSLIDDSYNANPTAVKAALEVLEGSKSRGKRIAAVLGDMRELGTWSEHYHREIGKVVAEKGLEFLITVGSDSRFIAEEAQRAGTPSVCAVSPEAAADEAHAREFDVLLVKGSRGVALDRTVKRLKELERRST